MRKWIAFLMAVIMCLSLCSCGGLATGGLNQEKQLSEAAKSCQDLIQSIGTVTLESKEAIENAEEAYAELTDEEKADISDSADVLTDARETYDALEKQAKIDNVIALIDAIDSKVTVKSKDAINDAEDAYEDLPEEDKAKVTNYSKLELAKVALGVALMEEQEKIKAEKEKVINKYSSKFNIDKDKVEGITWYMHKSKPKYIDTRSYIVPYIGMRDNGTPWICIRYNYTGDDWVFWDNLTIVTDNNKYTKSFSYYEITRDNGGGDVWEYNDEVLSVGASMDSSNIKMLKDIATSKETIIRFRGDDHVYDLYVTKEDKTIIKDVLAFYEALLP